MLYVRSRFFSLFYLLALLAWEPPALGQNCSLAMFLNAPSYAHSPLRRFFARKDAHLPQLPVHYLENAREAFHFFHGWMTHQNDLAFVPMLREMHRISALGGDGNHSFTSGGGAGEFDTATIEAGRTRDMLSYTSKPFTMLTPKDKLELGIAIPLQLLTFERWSPYAKQNDLGWRTPIKGIPDAILPGNRLSLGDILHYYPAGAALPIYLEQMGYQLEKVRALSNSDQEWDLLFHLGQYYHLGINALPFVRMNNSLLMNQVNFVLLANGMQPVQHGEIDFVALYTSTDDFLPLFLKHVGATPKNR